MRRTAFTPRISVASRIAAAKHHQRGGTIPGVHYGTGLLGNLLAHVKSAAIPTLKAIGKAALPLAKEAIAAGMASEGTLKQRMKRAAQSAATKENLLALAKAGAQGAVNRPLLVARPF